MADTADTSTRDLRDVYGRQYHVGQDAEALTGHSRRLLLWSAWLCMAAISPLQYGFGMAVPGLQAANDWGQTQTMWLLAVFVACQAGVAAPAAWMHRQSLARPAQLVVGGGVLATIGLLTLALVDSYAGSLLGYSVLGGAGAGLVYSACLTTAAKWFPERRVATIGFVTGGFAIGAVPVIVVLAVVGYSAEGVILTAAAMLALAVTVFAGRLLKDPPQHWWPPQIDAQAWAVDHRLNRSLPRNMPAVRHYTPGEALRTGVLPEIWFLLAAITAVSLFGIAFVASYAVAAGMGVAVAGVATAVLAAVNGVVRATAGHLSDRFGRTRVLTWVLALEGFAQFALVVSGESGHPWAFVACALLVGLGGGAFYAIFSNVVLEYFGDRSLLQNQAVVYSAKAVGGLVGIGGAAVLVSSVGYPPAFVVAGCLGLVAALMVRFLKQPGRPALDVHKQLGTPTVPSPVTTNREATTR